MTGARRLVGSSMIILALSLGISLLAGISAAKPESSGVSGSETVRQNLVDPALKRALEEYRAFQVLAAFEAGRETAEQGLLSGLPSQGSPQQADEIGVEEEINALIDLYAAKYHVSAQVLQWVAEHESTYNPEATGLLGERGLCQFLESTWKGTPQARFGWESAYSPALNIEACAWMLSQGRDSEFSTLSNK